MTTTPMHAADKDALIAAAAEVGITITRTSKDFFLGEGHNRERVTPGQIRAMIEDAQVEAAARAEALAAADEIRAQQAAGETVAVQPEPHQAPAGVPVEAAPEAPDLAPEATPVAEAQPETPAAAEVPAKSKVLYGPPCGGQIGHLGVATSEHARNPIVHVGELAAPRYKNKEEAGAAGRRTGALGHVAFLAQDKAGEQFWSVATVDAEGGNLKLDGAEINLTLLEGQAADDARALVKGGRNKQKAQWQAVAV